jgi:ATP-binding cassette subfamily F protein 3
VIEIENGAVTAYEGNYEDYLRRKEALAAPLPAPEAEAKARAMEIGSTIVIEGGYDASDRQASIDSSSNHRQRRLNPIKQKQMEDRCAFLEEEIPRIEASIAHTEEQLGVYVSAAETQRLADLAAELRAQLAALTAEWEGVMAQLEA